MALLKNWLYELVVFIARIHDQIEDYNKVLSLRYDDKQLHFLIMGAFGVIVLLLCWLLFRALADRRMVGLMAWLLAFFILVTVCFAVELGQQVTSTGKMELEDIVYGIVGFLAFSAAAEAVVLLIRLAAWLVRKIRMKRGK